ncbi:glycoside hydrolase 100 family protein [Croceiramulus getboli]|nr:glycoside hydrolase 100 family protein [Flavobacteriaceae bacterium YJPT1-3]
MSTPYQKAIDLLHQVSTERGYLASANDIANYRRIWARDGVICGLAGALDGDQKLVEAFKNTLITLADHQHELGNIPSNVHYDGATPSLSFGGLAGRVDTVSWFIIGVCQYAYLTGDILFFEQNKAKLELGFQLMHSWEYNDGDLMYVPRSGNWADEYPTQGFIFYDQVLRLWALRCYLHFEDKARMRTKHDRIQEKLELNFKKNAKNKQPYHPKAFESLAKLPYWAASLEPAGYQTQFDGFGNALALLLGLGSAQDQKELINYAAELAQELSLQLMPAFWPVITEEDPDWRFLVNNCKYEFRNFPYEFHNGGTWPMVNGFFGAGLWVHGKEHAAAQVLAKAMTARIHQLNALEGWSFYENFNSESGTPNGVPYCAWSAAGAVLLMQYQKGNQLLTELKS